MKLSKYFWQTYKEVPADAEVPSHQLMIRAGLIHKSGAGLYNYMPMGYRIIRKIEQITREELDKVGCNELLMTIVTPGELWKETNRWSLMDGMLKFRDRGDRDVCISPTNEETITDIFRKFVKSYKDLPLTLYQINTKFRDEIRPRFGILRAREFVMKDAYSFHPNKESLDEVYLDIRKAYEAILNRLGMEFMVVEADAGDMADPSCQTHEFQVIADTGEDDIVYTKNGSYAANIEKSITARPSSEEILSESALDMVETKDKKTIKDVSDLLGTNPADSLKAVVYEAISGDEGKPLVAFVLGDDEVNEVKLKAVANCEFLTPLSKEKVDSAGLVPGFIGPLNLPEGIDCYLDQEISKKQNLVCGANKVDYHFKNLSPERDLKEASYLDIRLTKEGDVHPENGQPILIKKGIEVGHIFQLGDKYSKSMQASVLDEKGKSFFPMMGCYGLGVSRLVAAIIEQSHDESGIIWPKEVAPYHLYLSYIGKSEEIKNEAESFYQELLKAGVEVLYDDRGKSPGFMFKDSELLGLPLRLVFGEREFNKSGNIELFVRKTQEKSLISPNDALVQIQKLLREM